MHALLEADAFPVLVHCAVGKDRTGVIIALLLDLAGVTDALIAEDYALSMVYLARNSK
ncbi:MAG: tyrosine-protein phosphatase [Chloroflexi bacterium]|nr:tyrosine-protein phosphatase [Chloroflexota bacterium]